MSPDELAVRGRALYGERWQTSLAQDLAVSDRTMRRWLAGESAIPEGIEDDLHRVLDKHMRVIFGLLGYRNLPF